MIAYDLKTRMCQKNNKSFHHMVPGTDCLFHKTAMSGLLSLTVPLRMQRSSLDASIVHLTLRSQSIGAAALQP